MELHPLIESLLKRLEQPTQLLQTHISWVILSGPYAYKIKKPVNFGFIDYTNLEKRKHFCDLEITLNKRLASSLYLNVVAITGTEQLPTLEGNGEPIEYAIKMRAFDQNHLFTNLIAHHDLTVEHIEAMSAICASFHQTAEICSDPILGTPESLMGPIRDNFHVTASFPAGKKYTAELEQIKTWAESTYQKFMPLLAERKAKGYIRACHGDLHLGNMVLFENKPMIFDCIEFNESFRWTDVMSDIGFFTMDLEDKKRPDFASRFVNRYLDLSHDYDGAVLLKFYQSYRAMVRAKVAAIQLEQCDSNSTMGKSLQHNLKSCIELALSYTQIKKPQLILTHGVSGSGKTTYTNQLLKDTSTIRLSADVIRKHLFKLPPFEISPVALQSKLYSDDADKQVSDKLLQLTEMLLKANLTVIVDATFIRRAQRKHFVELAKKLKLNIKALNFNVAEPILNQRLKAREKMITASDANFNIAKQQLAVLEPISTEEGIEIENIAP